MAVGLTAFFAMMIWSLWILNYGVPSSMAGSPYVPETFSAALIHSLWCLLKGFLFGFFVAVFYDLMRKCKRCCCKKSDGKCDNCGCPVSPEKK